MIRSSATWLRQFCGGASVEGFAPIRTLSALSAKGTTISLPLIAECGRRLYRKQELKVFFPSEFTHIAAAMAVAAKRPILVLKEKAVAERGTLRRGYVHTVVQMPNAVDSEWLTSTEFNEEFNKWLKLVNCHKHVFLGYSSQASTVADRIRKFIVDELHLTVFDWRDFQPSGTIWDSIEKGERLTDCGVFLFMADDQLSRGKKKQLAPRDNVVYEAGYFAGAKGRHYTTIIREKRKNTDRSWRRSLSRAGRSHKLFAYRCKIRRAPRRIAGGTTITLRCQQAGVCQSRKGLICLCHVSTMSFSRG